jgi:hypothetical protein
MTNADYHDHDRRHGRDTHFNGKSTIQDMAGILCFTAVKNITNDGNLGPNDFRNGYRN